MPDPEGVPEDHLQGTIEFLEVCDLARKRWLVEPFTSSLKRTKGITVTSLNDRNPFMKAPLLALAYTLRR